MLSAAAALMQEGHSRHDMVSTILHVEGQW